MTTEVTNGAAQADAVTTREDLAKGFLDEIAAESAPEKAANSPAETVETVETDDIEVSAETAAPDTEVSEDERTASDDEPAGEPDEAHDAQAIKAPSGMSAADKAIFDKLPTAAKAWISKREADRHADYQRKTSETAEIRKVADQKLQALTGALQHYDQILAKFTDNPLEPPDPALRQTDPFAFDEQMAHFVAAKHQQDLAIQERERNSKALEATRKEQTKAWVAEQKAALKDLAPDMADETEKGARLRKSVFEYAKKIGHSPEILELASALEMTTLMKAMRYDALTAAKSSAKPTASAAPKIAKPGPSKNAGGRPTNLAKAVQSLGEAPTRENLASAFLAEIQSERRS